MRYLGVDYYPEQWGMEHVDEDLKDITELGANLIRIADFAWDRFEPKDGEYYGVSNGDIVAVRIQTPERSIVFDDTVVRINENYRLAMHIDTDEANAAGLKGNGEGELIKL